MAGHIPRFNYHRVARPDLGPAAHAPAASRHDFDKTTSRALKNLTLLPKHAMRRRRNYDGNAENFPNSALCDPITKDVCRNGPLTRWEPRNARFLP